MRKSSDGFVFTRELVLLKTGEEFPADLLVNVPEGMRLETDEEFRARIKVQLDELRQGVL